MELDELKTAWQTLDRRLQRHNAINLQLFKDTKLEKARSGLRPLFWGQLLQLLLGIGLIVLGAACWTRNTDVPGLLVAGILVHAFGVVTTVAAGITLGLMGNIDYSAPVMRIQKQMALLLRFYTINANVCGLPWWFMWVLVVAAFAGLGQVDPQAATPAWIWASLAIGGVAWCFHLWWMRWRAQPARTDAYLADGADGIRRGQRILDEIAQFEKE